MAHINRADAEEGHGRGAGASAGVEQLPPPGAEVNRGGVHLRNDLSRGDQQERRTEEEERARGARAASTPNLANNGPSRARAASIPNLANNGPSRAAPIGAARVFPQHPPELIMESVWLPWSQGREFIEFAAALKDLSKEPFEV